ncbi:MAG: protein kinase, partial [Candidatus Bathyarchaeota archaeon]
MKSSFPLKPNQLNRLLAIAKEGGDTDTQEEILSRKCSVRKNKSDVKLPVWIGRYKITRMLGEGGMGIVYQAVQEHPVKRTVALKVIKPGMDSKQVIIRFENELQTLASLEHPNIA